MGFNEIFCLMNEYFRPILLIIASSFAIYFAFQKFGNKLSAQYTYSMGLFSAGHISNIVLSNKKDKAVSIWSVSALFEKDYNLVLEEFNPPIVLKPYETTSLSLPQFSSLSVGSDEYEPDYLSGKLDIFVDIGNELIKCSKHTKPDNLEAFTKVSKNSTVFNGHIFDRSVAYIISYYHEDSPHTAFVCKSGLIGNEWPFSPNHFGNEGVSAKTIELFLTSYGFSELFSNFVVFEVNYPNTTLAFKKVPKNA